MTASVRLRLVGWLHRVFNGSRKPCVKYLSGRKRHPQSGGNQYLGAVADVPNGASEGKMDDTVVVPAFQQNIDEFNRLAALGNAPSFSTDNNHLAGMAGARSFIIHQKSPFSENDPSLASLNAKLMGVES